MLPLSWTSRTAPKLRTQRIAPLPVRGRVGTTHNGLLLHQQFFPVISSEARRYFFSTTKSLLLPPSSIARTNTGGPNDDPVHIYAARLRAFAASKMRMSNLDLMRV